MGAKHLKLVAGDAQVLYGLLAALRDDQLIIFENDQVGIALDWLVGHNLSR